jgi:predicted HAD superfamily Cof-like phosphohydrolase
MNATPYDLVRNEFNPTFGVAQNEGPGQYPDLATKRLRWGLLLEEFMELAEVFGITVNDFIYKDGERTVSFIGEPQVVDTDLEQLAKESADLEYVLNQALAVAGIDGTRTFRRVHNSNMSKLFPDDKGNLTLVLRREDGKVLKGPHYRPPKMEDIVYGSSN